MDICGVDWPERPERFDVVYNLLSLARNQRIRVVVRTDGIAPVPSTVPALALRHLVRARGLGHVRHRLRGPDRPPAPADRLRLRGPPAAQGLPADRLCRGPLRRGAQAGRLRAGAPDPGLPQLRLPQPLGGDDDAAGRREGPPEPHRGGRRHERPARRRHERAPARPRPAGDETARSRSTATPSISARSIRPRMACCA